MNGTLHLKGELLDGTTFEMKAGVKNYTGPEQHPSLVDNFLRTLLQTKGLKVCRMEVIRFEETGH